MIIIGADEDIKWHSAFFGAIQLELAEYRNILEFIDEYQLSKEALRMDVLIIKKEKNINIEKNIGKIFKGNNIVEFKSETDYISINDFYKVCGYALLYKAFEDVAPDDITVTFVETKHPRDLIKHLKDVRGYKVTAAFDGVYYVDGFLFPIQIIESKKLSESENLWIKSLRSNLNATDMMGLLTRYREQDRFDLKSAYISTIIDANLDIIREVSMMGAKSDTVLLEIAVEKGWINEAEERKAIEMATAMLKEGDSIERVARISKLTIEKVKELNLHVVN